MLRPVPTPTPGNLIASVFISNCGMMYSQAGAGCATLLAHANRVVVQTHIKQIGLVLSQEGNEVPEK